MCCYGTPRSLLATNHHQPAYPRPTQVRKRSQSTSNLEKIKAASRETRQFGIYAQLKVELRKEDPITFQQSSAIQMKCMMKYLIRSLIVPGNNIPGTGSHWIPASSQLPLQAEFLYQIFKYAVLLTGRKENPLYSGQRSM